MIFFQEDFWARGLYLICRLIDQAHCSIHSKIANIHLVIAGTIYGPLYLFDHYFFLFWLSETSRAASLKNHEQHEY